MAGSLPKPLADLLRETSRSFYLTLRVLPADIRRQIALAYLLARTTDTVADTSVLPIDERLTALQQLRDAILGAGNAPDFTNLAGRQDWPAERELLEKVSWALAELAALSEPDRELVREVLSVIISGQELDLKRFSAASAGQIIALKDDAELDDYTHRVAGCVGEFWTRICRAHLFPAEVLDEKSLLANAVRFGKGLQLVNILRDLPIDLRNGRCYLPNTALASIKLLPSDLLKTSVEPEFKPVYRHYLDLAESHLRAGWEYTNTVPRRCRRVRLACAWPVLIGMETLARLRLGNILDSEIRIKISRSEVRNIMLRSFLSHPFPKLWRRLLPSSPSSPI